LIVYMVECRFGLPGALDEWNEWYGRHICKLLGMPGFLAAQRFQSTEGAYLAVYWLSSASALESEAYRAGAGPASVGRWREHMLDWHRNLLEGQRELPPVPAGNALTVLDRLSDDAPQLPSGFTSLRPIGLDRSIAERGVKIVPGHGPELSPGTDRRCRGRQLGPMGPIRRR
jgi:hypothetical protein